MDEMNQFDMTIMKWLFRFVGLFFVIGFIRHLLPILAAIPTEVFRP